MGTEEARTCSVILESWYLHEYKVCGWGLCADDEAAAAIGSASPQGLLEERGVHSCFLWSRCGLYRWGTSCVQKELPAGEQLCTGRKTQHFRVEERVGSDNPAWRSTCLSRGNFREVSSEKPFWRAYIRVLARELALNFCQTRSVGSQLKIVPVQVKYFPTIFYTWLCLILSAYSPLPHAHPSQKEEETS